MRGMVAKGEKFDACITDPPFHLTSITKRFGKKGSAPAQYGKDGAAGRLSKGFQGKIWDGVDEEGKAIAFDPETWKLVLALLKPGGRLLSFGGTRTNHRMACAIEDAGFEYEDCIIWVFGQGLVLRKSRLKPGWSPINMSRAPGPVQNLNIDACRVPYEIVNDGDLALNPQLRKYIKGGNGGISIAHEEESRFGVANELGRWSADFCHDGSDDIVAMFPNTPGQLVAARKDGTKKKANVYGAMNHVESPSNTPRNDKGSAARFFNTCGWTDEEQSLRLIYHAKCTAKDRCGSLHATVKPISLLRHLAKLTVPVGGRILDPFAGSGTMLEAAILENMNVVGIEREDEYCGDIILRMASLAARS